ncbi:MAG: NAD(P)-dependent oxidoreductase [Planctomycetota bacterium]
MRVLLTGATGFVGSHVLRTLLARGHHVAALIRPGSDTWRIAEVLARVRVSPAVLGEDPPSRSPTRLAEVAAEYRTDAIIHLAWTGVAGADRNAPEQVHNLPATLTLLETARAAGVRHYIALGSQAEHGPHNERIAESAPTQPTTLYGLCKLTACRLTDQFCDRHGLRWAWLRLFSAYGEMDSPAWLVPHVILALLRGERPRLTAGTQLWDYVHAADVAAAIVAVLEQPAATGVFNLGSGRAVPLRSVIERIRDLIDPQLPLAFGEVPYRPDQVMHLEADISRLMQTTGWAPRVPLDEGLARTVEWYRAHRARYER